MSFKSYLPLKSEINLFNVEKNPITLVIMAFTALFLAMYLYGIINFFMHGHDAYNVTRQFPWGLLMVMYEFFVGLAMGLGILGASIVAFDIKPLRFLAKRALLFGLLSLFAGFSVFLFEIGHPVRMVIYVAISGNLSSTLFWLGVFYPLFMLFSVLAFVNVGRKNEKIMATLALVFAICSIMTAGSIFGFLNSTPFANGIYYPIQFLLSSVAMGIFLLLLWYGINKTGKTQDFDVMIKLLGVIISILLLMSISRFLVGVYGNLPERALPIAYIYSSSNFLIWELFFGLVAPLLIILFASNKKQWLYIAAVPALVGYFFSRYNLIEGLQLYPKLMEKTREYQEAVTMITSYIPSLVEISLSIGGIGVAIVLYYVSNRVLELDN
jgi:molybdopterin-containing oxidoreductase family membrane subunit